MPVTAPGTHDPASNTYIPSTWGDAVNADLTDLDANSYRILSRSGTMLDINNTTTETTLFSVSVPANTLGTTKAVHLRLICDFLNNTGIARVVTVRGKYGGTTFFQDDTDAFTNSANLRVMQWDAVLSAAGSTSAQNGIVRIEMSDQGTSTTGYGNLQATGLAYTGGGNPAIDSTVAQTFELTTQFGVANTSLRIRRLWAEAIIL